MGTPEDRPAAPDRAVYVCGLAGLAEHAAALRPAGLVSLVTAFEQPPTPRGVAREAHLRLEVDDIEAPIPGFAMPDEADVAALIDFLGAWRPERPLLMHCAAGVSRSTAAALVALCLHAEGNERGDERGDERMLAQRLRRAAPHAAPNRRIVALADRLLGREGRLIAAVDALAPPALVLEGPLVRLPLEAD